jgi:hypothetical protein
MFLFDGCPYYEQHKSNGVFDVKYDKSINKIEFIQTEHYGGWGYYQRNLGMQKAEGDYTIFYDNDDVILPTHFENYYSNIAGTDYDMVYFNSFLQMRNQIRNSELSHGLIGHSEIIVKTEVLKSIAKQTSDYGHDYQMIQNIVCLQGKISKSNTLPTYMIMGTLDKREDDID